MSDTKTVASLYVLINDIIYISQLYTYNFLIYIVYVLE